MNFILYVANNTDLERAETLIDTVMDLHGSPDYSANVVSLMGSKSEGIPSEVLQVMMLKKTGTFPLLVVNQKPVLSGELPTLEYITDIIQNGVKEPAILVNRADSAVDFPEESRVHISVDVESIKSSLPFYKLLFDASPVKLREDYAKFELVSPSLNITLNQFREPLKGGPINHFGIQVKSSDVVLATKKRLQDAGFSLEEEIATACCYAVQTKIWATDPNGIKWEVYVVTEADTDEGCGPDCICFTELEPSYVANV